MSLRSNESSGFIGSTPCPKDEGIESHAGNVGEASEIDARQISQKAESVIGSDDSLESNDITRATTRFALEFRHAEKGKRCKGKDECSACTLLYALRVTQNRCASAINHAMRTYWSADFNMLDAYVEQHKEKPKGKDWPFPKLPIYQLIRESYPELASGIAASLSRKAMQKWRQTRFDTLIRNTCMLVHYRETMPIPIRRQEVRVVDVGEGVWNLRFSLTSGRHLNGTEYAVSIKARDDFQREALREISAGNWRMGEVALQPDRRKKGKWYARISFKRKIDTVPRTDRVGAINRGIICSLAAVTWDGDSWIDDGYDIEAYLQRCQYYRKQYQYSYALSQRKGKGRKRTLKPIDRLSGKAERWRETRLQTTARHFAMWFAAKGVSTVYIEDFSDIRNGAPEKLNGGKMVWDRIQEWPYYQLGVRLRSCLEEEGLRVVNVPLQSFSNRCPWCGYEHNEKPKILKSRTFICESCKKRVHYDVMQANNVMRCGIEFEQLCGETKSEALYRKMTDKDAKNGVTLEESKCKRKQKNTSRKPRCK